MAESNRRDMAESIGTRLKKLEEELGWKNIFATEEFLWEMLWMMTYILIFAVVFIPLTFAITAITGLPPFYSIYIAMPLAILVLIGVLRIKKLYKERSASENSYQRVADG